MGLGIRRVSFVHDEKRRGEKWRASRRLAGHVQVSRAEKRERVREYPDGDTG